MLDRRSSPACAIQLPFPNCGNGSASPRHNSASIVAVLLGSSAAMEKWKIMTAPHACSHRRQRYTMAMPIAKLTDIKNRVGQEVGVSDWIAVDQARINAFADATEDRQFIHVDPAAAGRTPFGETIAH